jgi:hypothetical protein
MSKNIIEYEQLSEKQLEKTRKVLNQTIDMLIQQNNEMYDDYICYIQDRIHPF